jgi:hypothetical protein
MRRTTYTCLPCSTGTPLETALATRGRATVVQTQIESWFFALEQVRVDPELRDELAQIRAAQAPIVKDRALIVRACVAGAVTPDEAVTLFRRTQG